MPETEGDTMKKSQPMPEPVPVNVVCSLCGEGWALHLEDERGEVSTLECIRLLKAKKTPTAFRPWPVYPTYPTYPYGTWYTGGTFAGQMVTTRSNTTTAVGNVQTTSTSFRTPIVASATADA